MLYERRMENSMVKMIRELKKLQAERETEQAGAASCRGRLARASRGHLAHDWGQPSQTDPRAAEQQSPAESPPAPRHRTNLKKQSQFAAEQVDVNSSHKCDYENKHCPNSQENKANNACLEHGRTGQIEQARTTHSAVRA
jgi:hypothetical protein